MNILQLLTQVSSLEEARMSGVGDKVNRMVQKELWPLIKPLEMKTANGTTVMRRDKDGSVLQALKQKSTELINQYSGVHKQKHLDVVNAATNYQDILKLMTNVMMFNMGQGVLKESTLNSLPLQPSGEFVLDQTNHNHLQIHYSNVQYQGNRVTGDVSVSDDTIQFDPQFERIAYVTVKFDVVVYVANGEPEFHDVDVQLIKAPATELGEKQASEEYFNTFVAKYHDHKDRMLELLEFEPDLVKIRNGVQKGA